jgi:hypothetical protein
MLGDKQIAMRRLGDKYHHNSSSGKYLSKKPDDSEGIINESNNHDTHHEPMGISNAKKSAPADLEKHKKCKSGNYF